LQHIFFFINVALVKRHWTTCHTGTPNRW
jgi:hypothetical protein